MSASRSFVRLDELVVAANSNKMPGHMLVYFDRETRRESKLANDLSELMTKLLASVKERKPFVEELEGLRENLVAYKMREKLKNLQKDDLEKVMELTKIVLQLRRQVYMVKMMFFLFVNERSIKSQGQVVNEMVGV
ncbi:hypothetical protein Tco_1504948 [Tanacetum coccineum]